MPENTTNASPTAAQPVHEGTFTLKPDAPVAVRFKNVTKRYKLYKNDRRRLIGLLIKKIPFKTICANDNLSFTIRKGETVAFLGHNGAGKSTLLKMVTGVVYPSEGEVEVNGRVSAMLELKAGFDRDLTGRENVVLRGRIQGLSEEEIKKIMPKVIKFAELGDYFDQPMRTYSSGMKARLGFAFASYVNPEILIVDEALSVGDRNFRKKCRRRVRRIMNTQDLTLLFVTHSTGTARKFCERGIVLEHGRLLFDGPIEDAINFYEGKDEQEEALEIAEEQKEAAAEAADEAAAEAAVGAVAEDVSEQASQVAEVAQ